MAKNKKKSDRQFAALPYRLGPQGLQVLLVTSRETRRWLVPKGWAESGVPPHELAALEAFEEAGVVGEIDPTPFGRYRYEKRLADGTLVPLEVDVYPLAVTRILEDWPEKGQRERRWMTPGQAAMTTGEAGLVEILLRLGLAGA
ncbi:NUDIX hydrolase [Oleisolibacter albus]|uniref:NUDIX hydrolase n=1 Tax=Oleisolibacter albus TaxID=2171757 RepID=UPI000DF2743C|nr:NUDIX hydrolase [Oleisolibacter albus]